MAMVARSRSVSDDLSSRWELVLSARFLPRLIGPVTELQVDPVAGALEVAGLPHRVGRPRGHRGRFARRRAKLATEARRPSGVDGCGS